MQTAVVERGYGSSWSDFELALVEGLYPHRSWRRELYAAMPHRSRDAVRLQAVRLGVTECRRIEWTAAMDVAVMRAYRERGGDIRGVAARLGVSHSSVCARAVALGLPRRRHPWTPAELVRLKAEWHEVTARELRRKFPKHSWKSILQKGAQLGMTLMPQGTEVLNAAAERTNFCRRSLLRLLERQGVRARHAYHVRGHTVVARTRYYEPDDVDAAIARDMRLESLRDAAARHKVSPRHLYDVFRRVAAADAAFAGIVAELRRGRHARLDPDTTDKIMARAGKTKPAVDLRRAA